MPYKDPIKRKEYNSQYHTNIKNKERRKQRDRTPEGIKSCRITNWKKQKVKEDDWDLLYDIFINTWECNICDKPLVEGGNKNNMKCLDHDHHTGYYRGILCHKCNKLDNLGL